VDTFHVPSCVDPSNCGRFIDGRAWQAAPLPVGAFAPVDHLPGGPTPWYAPESLCDLGSGARPPQPQL